MPSLEKVARCSSTINGSECNSAIFYDWGLQIMKTNDVGSVSGGLIEKWKDFSMPDNVRICARCTTPYILEGGSLIDVSEELSAEDVKLILSRGQSTLPHVKIKDP